MDKNKIEKLLYLGAAIEVSNEELSFLINNITELNINTLKIQKVYNGVYWVKVDKLTTDTLQKILQDTESENK